MPFLRLDARLVCVFVLVAGLLADAPRSSAREIVFREALVLEPAGRAGRNTLFTDAVESRIVAGTWTPPAAGEVVSVDGLRTRTWTNAVAGDDGWFTGRALRGGWAYFSHAAAESEIMILQAAGHSMAYVNGEPRAGDVYQYGYVQLPIQLAPGTNEILLAAGRGRVRASLVSPKAPAFFNLADPTLPDLVVGRETDAWGAVIVINATPHPRSDLELRVESEGRSARSELPEIPALGMRKVGFRLPAVTARTEGKSELKLSLGSRQGNQTALDQGTLEVRVRRPDQTRKRTFVSGIDGSIQYYALNPMSGADSDSSPALFLSLHGASVEGVGQAEAYAPKRWGHLVSPTNRRPYGFDWEEWGRLDALEVLDLATASLGIDRSRVYLTGHSMGGHGTWNLGATFPDRFAAIAPSAGWISFFSYAGTDPYTNATPVEAILRRAAASSDTLALASNYLHHGVYILHGDADDNVPVREARRMREVLGGFHHDFDGHEQPGAGHWWGNSDEPGSACVDWPPIFDLFARRRIPAPDETREVRFVTVNPGVSARSRWLGIEAQQSALLPSRADVRWDPVLRRFVGGTHNVARLVLETADLGPVTNGFVVELDGQRFEQVRPVVEPPAPGPITAPGGPGAWRLPLRFARQGDQWTVSPVAPATDKGPWRHGPFKDAFRHRMLFVYGTRGSPEENAWALAKARFDAESFWYRGNGSVDLLADTAFRPADHPDRGVILYGHSEMNAAWPVLLAASPVQVRRGQVAVGSRIVSRDDAACLFLRPRPDSAFASVGVVAGTGLPGLRLTNRLPYFLAGTAYPDCLVVGADALTRGNAGIVAAGFFGPDWSLDRGEFAWNDGNGR